MPRAGDLSLGELPAELQQLIIQRVDFSERHQSMVFVCRGWRELVHAPQLLRKVQVGWSSLDKHTILPRLRAFSTWLVQRAAPHVRRFSAVLDGGPEGMQPAETAECTALWTEALAACTQLTELVLQCDDAGVLPPLGDWLAPAGATLRNLHYCDCTTTLVSGSLAGLTALEQLELGVYSEDLQVGPAAAFPPTLTRLHLGHSDEQLTLPPQLSALTGLRELQLCSPWFGEDSYWPLLHMPALTRLVLYSQPGSLPGCLAQLTQLRSLSVEHEMSPLEDGFQVLASSLPDLPHLSSLTHLQLSLALEEAYAALPLLPALRSLWLSGNPGPAFEAVEDSALPGGAWLRNLRTLAMSSEALVHSLPALREAVRLEQLVVDPRMTEEEVAAFLALAEERPSLQLVLLRHEYERLQPREGQQESAWAPHVGTHPRVICCDSSELE